MKSKTSSPEIRRMDWSHLSSFEKIGFSLLIVFFVFMLYMFFVVPLLGE